MSQIFQFLHLVTASLFLGCIVSSLALKFYAESRKDILGIVFALRAILFLDRLLTAPSAGLLTASGFCVVFLEDMSVLRERWLQLSIALWFASAIAAVGYLIPSLRRLLIAAETGSEAGMLDATYQAASRRWNVASAVLIVTPLIIISLAIAKPSFRW